MWYKTGYELLPFQGVLSNLNRTDRTIADFSSTKRTGARNAISLSNVNYPYLHKTETQRGKNQCFLVIFRMKNAK